MTESVKGAIGRRVVSRSSAEELGSVGRLVVDAASRRAVAIVVGKGRKARVVAWSDISGFGPDAVMVTDDAVIHDPADGEIGAADLLGQRVLSELGNELGTIADVEFDPATGELETLLVGDLKLAAATILGNGSYALVLDRTTDPG